MIFKKLLLLVLLILKITYSNQFSGDGDPTKLGPCKAELVDGSIIDLSKLKK
jgi:hypothetical protein